MGRIARLPFPLVACAGDREHAEQAGERDPQLAARHDGVHEPMLEQPFGALEALGQLLAHGPARHPGPGKADERSRLGQDHVAERGEARPARRRWSGR